MVMGSTVKGEHYRGALAKKSFYWGGWSARELLRGLMTPASYEDFLELEKEFIIPFPHHTIEFSIYEPNVGLFPHRNTMFWEVRNY